MSDRTLRQYTKRAEKNVSSWPQSMQRATTGRYLAPKTGSEMKKPANQARRSTGR
jgi:hypothetical protein